MFGLKNHNGNNHLPPSLIKFTRKNDNDIDPLGLTAYLFEDASFDPLNVSPMESYFISIVPTVAAEVIRAYIASGSREVPVSVYRRLTQINSFVGRRILSDAGLCGDTAPDEEIILTRENCKLFWLEIQDLLVNSESLSFNRFAGFKNIASEKDKVALAFWILTLLGADSLGMHFYGRLEHYRRLGLYKPEEGETNALPEVGYLHVALQLTADFSAKVQMVVLEAFDVESLEPVPVV